MADRATERMKKNVSEGARNHPKAARAAAHRGAGGYTPLAVSASTRIRVVVAFHSIFYAPLPVAIHGGHFAAQGLEVHPETPALAAGPAGALQSGAADLFP